jgi:hypothetical protein
MSHSNPRSSNSFTLDPVFTQLANRYLDNALTAEELKTFNNDLRTHDSKREAFKWLCITHCALARELDEHEQFQLQLLQDAVDAGDAHPVDLNDVAILPAIHEGPDASGADDSDSDDQVFDPPPPIPLPRDEKSTKRRYWAAGLLLPLLMTGWYGLRPGPAKSMARIETSLDARWVSPQDAALQAGSALPPGIHTLGAGVVKLTLQGHNELVVQGPAEFEIIAESTVNLTRGKLCARMGAKEGANHRGLTVVAPDLKAVDLGTEFGIDVSEGTATHLEVFEGIVEAKGNGSNNFVRLTANQAVRVSAGSSTIRTDEPHPTEFLRTADVDALAANFKAGNNAVADTDTTAIATLADDDIGTPQMHGQSSFCSGIWKVSADGHGFANRVDQFHFSRTSIDGNGAMVVELVRSARLSQTTQLPDSASKISIRTSAEDPESPFVPTRTLIAGMQPLNSRSGIMFRNSDDPAAPFVALVMTGGAGVELISRDTSGAVAKILTKTAHTRAPIWLKLERTDAQWSAFSSEDGYTWTPRGKSTVDLPAEAYGGLVVSSASDNLMTTALFSHLSFSK